MEIKAVFGPGRPTAAIKAIADLKKAEEVASKVCWTNEGAQKRLRRAQAIRNLYREYGDSFRGH